jgi:hypothetical protein
MIHHMIIVSTVINSEKKSKNWKINCKCSIFKIFILPLHRKLILTKNIEIMLFTIQRGEEPRVTKMITVIIGEFHIEYLKQLMEN